MVPNDPHTDDAGELEALQKMRDDYLRRSGMRPEDKELKRVFEALDHRLEQLRAPQDSYVVALREGGVDADTCAAIERSRRDPKPASRGFVVRAIGQFEKSLATVIIEQVIRPLRAEIDQLRARVEGKDAP